ncbi:MAG: nucleoside-diphosphate kinase [Parcubacteria group bacterium Gr01-1014_3]|nr:MAG: nucleoside-diphosphate kinase [Parcubacteria group bacterium Gr01-1014_3]
MKLKQEQTLVLIKPDGVQRGLIGAVIGRLERVGLKLVGIKLVTPNAETIGQHYAKMKDPVLGHLKRLMTSGPVVAMAWEGAHAIGIVRKLIGGTEPLSSDVGTIRGDYTVDSYQLADADNRAVRNIVHASGNAEEAKAEINLWFKSDDLARYRLVSEAILYDVNLDGILE